VRVGHARQLDVAFVLVRETHGVRRKGAQLADDLRSMRRGQEAQLPGHEGRRETHREVVAVGAGVEYVVARAEPLRYAPRVGKELAGANRYPGAIGDDRAGGRVRYQRQRG
jgi:hypothetical protein